MNSPRSLTSPRLTFHERLDPRRILKIARPPRAFPPPPPMTTTAISKMTAPFTPRISDPSSPSSPPYPLPPPQPNHDLFLDATLLFFPAPSASVVASASPRAHHHLLRGLVNCVQRRAHPSHLTCATLGPTATRTRGLQPTKSCPPPGLRYPSYTSRYKRLHSRHCFLQPRPSRRNNRASLRMSTSTRSGSRRMRARTRRLPRPPPFPPPLHRRSLPSSTTRCLRALRSMMPTTTPNTNAHDPSAIIPTRSSNQCGPPRPSPPSTPHMRRCRPEGSRA
ncbi:hypothetical protein C8J57DRAFT_1310682, partial [Mycena rebaudengoi]